MDRIKKTAREVFMSVIPITILVFLLNISIVPTDIDITIRFILGSIFVLIGLTIFLIGVDLSMNIIGKYMGRTLAHGNSIIFVLILALVLGFLITVAEPSSNVLAGQIEEASGGILGQKFLVYIISFGFGALLSLGVIRILKGFKYNIFMIIGYSIALILGLIIYEDFFALAFDSGASSTGALTTPFILAIAHGVSKAKGGKKEEENSFGMVGVATIGPIISVLLIMILTGQSNIQGDVGTFVYQSGIIQPFISELGRQFIDAIIALLGISLLFYIFNFFKFKIDKDENRKMLIGLGITVIGLTIFLTGINSGFMDMGRIIGEELGKNYKILLPIVGAILGMIVVLAEPSVQILGNQVEEATAGAISKKMLKISLSIGVGIAMALSMLKIQIPSFKLAYMIYPIFISIFLLSLYIDDIFVGIAYDAGGVASGPMTATFIVAFAQGAASGHPNANLLIDGFGIISAVAMTPIFAVSVLGAVFKIMKSKKRKRVMVEEENKTLSSIPFNSASLYTVVDKGDSDYVIDLARKYGAKGATILHGRRSDNPMLKIFDMEIHEEKDIVFFVVDIDLAWKLSNILTSELDIDGKTSSIYIVPSGFVK